MRMLTVSACGDISPQHLRLMVGKTRSTGMPQRFLNEFASVFFLRFYLTYSNAPLPTKELYMYPGLT
jgi:hypothetical protein